MSIERSPRKAVPMLGDHHRQELQYHYQPNKNLTDDAFRIEGFFPQSVTENPVPFTRENSVDAIDRFSSGSFDFVDGRLDNELTSFGTPKERWPRQQVSTDPTVDKLGHSISSDDGKGFNIDDDRSNRFKDNVGEPRFSSSNESERKFFGYGPSSSDMFDDNYTEESRQRIGKNFSKIKGARQKQLEDDDLDSDTKMYGKSPKFDENHGNFGPYEASKSGNYLSRSEQYSSKIDRDVERYDRRLFNARARRFRDYSDEVSFEDDQLPRAICNRDGVVFNTLEGFENDNMIAVCENAPREDDVDHLENMNLENTDYEADDNFQLESNCRSEIQQVCGVLSSSQQGGQRSDPSQENYLRNTVERKFSAGQIKRPLSQDEDVSTKSGRILEGPEVTPGDVGRMLNLGNALDGPRQTQANKYLSLVTLHLPVILRLSVNCPFQNVRIKCAEILQMVKVRKYFFNNRKKITLPPFIMRS